MIDLNDLGNGGTTIFGLEAGDMLRGPNGGLAGDINGDGIDDLLLTSQGTTINGDDGAGVVYVLLGGLPFDEIDLSGVTYRGTAAAYAGTSLSFVGDVDQDGFADLVFGAPGTGADFPTAHLFFGGETYFEDNPDPVQLGFPATEGGVTAIGDIGWGTGTRVAGVGDVNGDGLPDFLIGEPGRSDAGTERGTATLVFGQPERGTFPPDFFETGGPPLSFEAPPIPIYGANDYDSIGRGSFGGGDFNGDGLSDLVFASAAGTLQIEVLLGSDTLPYGPITLGTDTIKIGSSSNTGSVANVAVGDFNGDGIDDLAVGTPGYAGGRGAVFMLYGSSGFDDADLAVDGVRRAVGTSDGQALGAIVASLGGDFNGDGIVDLAAGGGGSDFAVLLFGQGDSPPDEFASIDDLPMSEGVKIVGEGLQLVQLTGPGDVNGDGLADLGISSPNANGAAGRFDILYGFATAGGTDGDDSLTGGAANDQLDGGAGNDTIFGNAGADLLSGNSGNDLLAGGDGNDTIGGDAGDDRCFGQAGDDTLMGGIGNDDLKGNLDNDSVIGEEGNDTLRGQVGTDMVDGGVDDDLLFGGGGDDTVEGATGNDMVNGNSGADTVNGGDGDDTVRGQGGNDVVNGNAGNDLVLGISGLDSLFGGDGNDTLTGGVGNDQCTGGAGSDIFQFGPMQGADVITDFENGSDWMSFVGVSSFGELAIVNTDEGVAITLASEGNSPTLRVTLNNVTAAQLDASDFIFG